MKSIPDISRTVLVSKGLPILLFLCLSSSFPGAQPASTVILWDAGVSTLTLTNLEDHSSWKMVPSDLLTLEADPAKASSDPGYYGRDYDFKGDAIVENEKLLAAFSSESGRMALYSKPGSLQASNSSQGAGGTLLKILELSPSTPPGVSGPAHLAILRNADDEVILQIAFNGSAASSIVFSLGRTEIIEVKPSGDLKAFAITAPFEYAIVPSFIGDDLIYGAQDKDAGDRLNVPSENALLGLLRGEATQFFMTWPRGQQKLSLGLGDAANGVRPIDQLRFENDGRSFYLAPMAAAGIWHRETLTPAYLEKDVMIDWKKPFPARWKTELYEEAVKTSFAFKSSKGDIWRGVPGSYDYPVWFDRDQTFYHLSKKVPPKGESVIYFLEGQGTPASIQTPVDILKATLGREMAEPILDVAGRKLRTHHRRGGDGVHRACTCGCTEAIQAVFEAGEEAERRDDIQGDLQDMMYFVHHHVDRINEYRRFADEMINFLHAKKSSAPELGEYIDGLEQTIQQIPQECSVQQENMKSFAFADELVKRTMALTEKKDPDNLKAYMELLKEWRGMGGAQDYVLAQCHIITRKLAQQAGYGCANQPKAVALAQEVRARARQCLRNPDGYEIWTDY
jgi:hypothetical protein